MVALSKKSWQEDVYLYVELSAYINGIHTTYTHQFPIYYDLQQAFDLCLSEFNNANGGGFTLEA